MYNMLVAYTPARHSNDLLLLLLLLLLYLVQEA